MHVTKLLGDFPVGFFFEIVGPISLTSNAGNICFYFQLCGIFLKIRASLTKIEIANLKVENC